VKVSKLFNSEFLKADAIFCFSEEVNILVGKGLVEPRGIEPLTS
jgi:hypothetical protein